MSNIIPFHPYILVRVTLKKMYFKIKLSEFKKEIKLNSCILQNGPKAIIVEKKILCTSRHVHYNMAQWFSLSLFYKLLDSNNCYLLCQTYAWFCNSLPYFFFFFRRKFCYGKRICNIIVCFALHIYINLPHKCVCLHVSGWVGGCLFMCLNVKNLLATFEVKNTIWICTFGDPELESC